MLFVSSCFYYEHLYIILILHIYITYLSYLYLSILLYIHLYTYIYTYIDICTYVYCKYCKYIYIYIYFPSEYIFHLNDGYGWDSWILCSCFLVIAQQMDIYLDFMRLKLRLEHLF